MNKTVLLLSLALLASILFADPFGLKMGMTLEEIQEKCGGRKPECFGPSFFEIEPIRKNDRFVKYVALFDDAIGLFGVTAETEATDIKTCELKLKDLISILEQYYGKPSVKGDNGCIWDVTSCKTLKKERLFKIQVVSGPIDDGKKREVALIYLFENFQKIQEPSDGPF